MVDLNSKWIDINDIILSQPSGSADINSYQNWYKVSMMMDQLVSIIYIHTSTLSFVS